MPKFIVGARLHDYGKGSPDELFGRVAADGFAAVQLAYKKCVPSVRSYADVTDALVAGTVAAEKAHSIQVAVLGTYVELAINDESRLKNAADFKSQLAVCKALGAGCIGTETTSMEKQPAGTTREEAQELLCRSLADILPAAEALGVTVAVEPVTYHSMNSAAATRHILDTMRSPNLKVIFDMSNLVDAGNVGAQDRIWNDVGELLGDGSWPSTSRGRLLRRTAGCSTRVRRTARPTTRARSPCCGSCRRTLCPCCVRRLCQPALPVILHL